MTQSIPLGIEEMLDIIPEPNGAALRRFWRDHEERFRTSPGSRRSHQAWPGGYQKHLEDTMNLALRLYPVMNEFALLPFTVEDALVVLFLHDLEKPWLYVEPSKGGSWTKAERHEFRRAAIEDYGIQLTPEQENALRYAEGEGEDYRAGERVMGELAAFVHMMDVASARIYWDLRF